MWLLAWFASASLAHAFQVTNTIPANAARSVSGGAPITVYFDSAVNTSTVHAGTFRVRSVRTGFKSGTYSVGSASATFQPSQAFVPGDEVVVTLSTNIASAGGARLKPCAFQFFATAFGCSSFTCAAGQAMGSCVDGQVVLADTDADGDLDACIVCDECDIWTNDGTGAFFAGGQDFGGGSAGVSEVAFGDLNGDGLSDAFVARLSDPSQVWTNNGSGVFCNSGQSLNGTGTSVQVVLGDVDGDGDLDAWETRMGAGRIWLNNGHGVFSDSGQRPGMVTPTGIALGDLDKDGDLDAFVATENSASAGPCNVWLNNGVGVFSNSQALGNQESGGVALGDLDGDGDLDALVPCFTPGGKIWLNNGAGLFTTGTSFAGYAHLQPALGDMDGDGDLDAVMTEWSTNYTRVWLNNGSGQFSDSGRKLDVGSTAWAELGDVDKDGDLDILLGSQSEPHRLWLNQGCQALGADLAITVLDAPDPAPLGGALTYTILVTNRGPSSAIGVVVTDVLSDAVTFSSAWVSRGSVSQSSGQVTCVLGDFVNGAAACITVTVSTVRSTIATNRASVSASVTDAVPANNTVQTLTRVSPADLSIRKSVSPATASVGASLAFTLAVSNAGPFTATQVHVVDRLPTNLVLQSASASQGAWSNDDGLVGCDLGSLTVGATASITVTALVANWAATDNVASVSGAELDANPGDNSASVAVRSPGFSDTGLPFIDLQSAETIAWADYDRDGDPDFYFCGLTALPSAQYTCKVYRNDGDGSFHDIGIPDLAITGGAVSWADYDNDGDLDLLVSGEDRIAKHARAVLYRNLGADTFAATQTLMDVDFSGRSGFHSYPTSSSWGDYDNDGDLDLLFSGFDASYNSVLKLFRNTGGVFADSGVSLAPLDVHASDTAWGDYDGDGDMDFMVSGWTYTNVGYGFVAEFRLYRNNGDGSFALVPTSIPGMVGELAWGDYDNDGDLDIFIAGHDHNYNYYSRIYRNNGGDSFGDIGAPFQPVGSSESSSLDWGDMNNDGRLDALLVGVVGVTVTPYNLSCVYLNDGAAAFTDINAALLGVAPGAARWADYDRDGDLDVMIAGDSVVKLYRNELNFSNTPPASPTGLSSSTAGVHVTLAWRASSDVETPGSGLTYNLRVGTTPGGSEICSAQSTPEGRRLLHAMGNAGSRTNWQIKGLADGVYFWSVQAVDSTYEASPFAAEGQFQINALDSEADLVLRKTVSPTLIPFRSNLVYTLLVSNAGPDSAAGVLLNDPLPANVSFVSALASQGTVYDSAGVVVGQLGELAAGSTATVTIRAAGTTWGVSTNTAQVTSGASDTNATNNIAQAVTRIEPFTEISLALLNQQAADRICWGDYDRDGDLDLFFSGATNMYTTLILKNSGGGVFTNAGTRLISSSEGSGAWGDYDNDGDLDLVVSGDDSVQDRSLAVLYRNNTGSFVVAQTLVDFFYIRPPYRNHESATAWGDYDNDGDLDLLLTGDDAATNRCAWIFRDDHGTLVNSGIALNNIESRMAEWVDYDADGDLDVFLMGYYLSTGSQVHFYRNDGSNVFTLLSTAIVAVNGDFSWGDYDNDGDMDLLIAGHTASSVRRCDIYQNLGNSQFTNINAGLTPVGAYGASVDWGDYDNDGDLDVLEAGISPTRITKVYENLGGNVFRDIGATLTGVKAGAVRWGDYDGDGDLDFIAAGEGVLSLYRNELNPSVATPSAPQGLNVRVSGSNALMAWTASTDAETPAEGLTYNLCVGTSSGAVDVISPMSLGSGRRLVVEPGEQCHRTSWTLRGLPGGMYSWAVQAVDQTSVGSPFSAQRYFGIGASRTQDTDSDGLPDWYELSYSGGATNLLPDGDPDGDHVSTHDELAAGTDPLDGLSQFVTEGAAVRGDDGVVVQWSSVANFSYRLERSSNLVEFISVGSGIPATPPLNVYTDHPGRSARSFYRVTVE